MLTITDLSLSHDLDTAERAEVRGGMLDLPGIPASFFEITNAPTIDAGTHLLNQGQSAAINQAGNLGGLNLVINDQSQFGISGQVA